ncbi:MAG: hypothetical protein HYS06_02460 [Methylocystis sp.]|nr:hypothetical protein [Methylocystis sp.]
MDQASVNRLICAVRQTNGMLQILDAEKENASITLGELQGKFHSQYGIDPSAKDFAFYNQHQFLTSLLAYLCMPSEKFYEKLPEIKIDSLAPGWGAQGLFFSGSLKGLVRHLRNAISHGHLSVSPELIFEFRDRNSVVVFNHLSLHKFCQALAYWCLTKDVALTKL